MDTLKPFDYHTQLLSKVLDLRAEKAQVIASNIANAETPGFTPSEFTFEQDLANAIHGSKNIDLSVSNSAHFLIGPSNFNSVNGKITTVMSVKKIVGSISFSDRSNGNSIKL